MLETNKIQTYFLLEFGLEITEILEFYSYLILKPYGVIPFKDRIYKNKAILKDIILYSKKISNISPLLGVTRLESINLYNNKIKDISHLSSITNLTYLNLRLNKIRDILPLSSLYKLEELHLDKSISRRQIEELKIKIPNCNIYYKWD